jgi:hypothetical protein
MGKVPLDKDQKNYYILSLSACIGRITYPKPSPQGRNGELPALGIDRPECDFRVYMIQDKTSIRLLKSLGIALVALPEPFTTPFGVALLFAANHLSQKSEPGLENRLPEALAYQSYWFKHPGDYTDNTSSDLEKVMRSAQSKQPPTPWLYADSLSLEANPKPSVRQTRRERRDREHLAAPPIGEPISLPARELWY